MEKTKVYGLNFEVVLDLKYIAFVCSVWSFTQWSYSEVVLFLGWSLGRIPLVISGCREHPGYAQVLSKGYCSFVVMTNRWSAYTCTPWL